MHGYLFLKIRLKNDDGQNNCWRLKESNLRTVDRQKMIGGMAKANLTVVDRQKIIGGDKRLKGHRKIVVRKKEKKRKVTMKKGYSTRA